MEADRKDSVKGKEPRTAMPALFVGHGNPMNGIEDNAFSHAWEQLGAALPRPQAVLCISAHWLTEGIRVNPDTRPRTIHDFWGFPEELYRVRYDCPGAPALAERVRSLVRTGSVEMDANWGIDHGAWVPLRRLFPMADVPVVQLSIDVSMPSRFHYEIGRQLAPLREQGVLIIGSGNLVHNLGRVSFDPGAAPYGWAKEFDEQAVEFMKKGDDEALIAYELLGPAAALSIPTPDHYWPLLYILALREEDEPLSFPVEGIAHGSVSMRAVAFGLA